MLNSHPTPSGPEQGGGDPPRGLAVFASEVSVWICPGSAVVAAGTSLWCPQHPPSPRMFGGVWDQKRWSGGSQWPKSLLQHHCKDHLLVGPELHCPRAGTIGGSFGLCLMAFFTADWAMLLSSDVCPVGSQVTFDLAK